MRRLLLSTVCLALSLPFVLARGVNSPSGPSRPLPNTPKDVPPPVILPSTNPPITPADQVPFIDPITMLGFNSWITVHSNSMEVLFEQPVSVYSVQLTNENTGETVNHYVGYLTTMVSVSVPMSNGLWRICISTLSGAHYYGSLFVNDASFGPLVPCEWIQ